MRRNNDEQARALQRQALATGDPLVAYEAYAAERRAGVRIEATHVEAPSYSVVTSHGDFRVAPTGSQHGRPHLYVQTQSGPWIVNRVPIRWNAHFYMDRPDVWLPHSTARLKGESRTAPAAFGARDSAPAATLEDMLEAVYSYVGTSLHAWRTDRPNANNTTSSQDVKLLKLIVPLVNQWAAMNAEAIRIGIHYTATQAVQKVDRELSELEGALTELRAKLGSSYLDYLKSLPR